MTPPIEHKETSRTSTFFSAKEMPRSVGLITLKLSAVLIVCLLSFLAVFIATSGPGHAMVPGAAPIGGTMLSVLCVIVVIAPTLLLFSMVAHFCQWAYRKNMTLLFMLLGALFLGLLIVIAIEIYFYAAFAFEETDFWQRHYNLLNF